MALWGYCYLYYYITNIFLGKKLVTLVLSGGPEVVQGDQDYTISGEDLRLVMFTFVFQLL